MEENLPYDPLCPSAAAGRLDGLSVCLRTSSDPVFNQPRKQVFRNLILVFMSEHGEKRMGPIKFGQRGSFSFETSRLVLGLLWRGTASRD